MCPAPHRGLPVPQHSAQDCGEFLGQWGLVKGGSPESRDQHDRHAGNSPSMTRPLKALTDAEELTCRWLDWYNNGWMHSSLRNVHPKSPTAPITLKQTAR